MVIREAHPVDVRGGRKFEFCTGLQISNSRKGVFYYTKLLFSVDTELIKRGIKMKGIKMKGIKMALN